MNIIQKTAQNNLNDSRIFSNNSIESVQPGTKSLISMNLQT